MADVTVIEAREGTELGSYKGEANLAGAAWGGQGMVSGLSMADWGWRLERREVGHGWWEMCTDERTSIEILYDETQS